MQKADRFYRKNLRAILFQKLLETFSLIKIERNIKEAKNLEKAKNFYLFMLRKKLFSFLKRYQIFNQKNEKNFDNIRAKFLKRMVFSKWFEKLTFLKEKNKKKEAYYSKIIDKFRLVLQIFFIDLIFFR